ncbi:MAG: hypothetical protein M1812_006251 [Candelaria pacifica]|nr:MAG: hypothetical protein M1812_006251 [Candelaria pacifica]
MSNPPPLQLVEPIDPQLIRQSQTHEKIGHPVNRSLMRPHLSNLPAARNNPSLHSKATDSNSRHDNEHAENNSAGAEASGLRRGMKEDGEDSDPSTIEVEDSQEAVDEMVTADPQADRSAQQPNLNRSGIPRLPRLAAVSPIKEEGSELPSPSLDAALASPLPAGAQTASTASTESTRTVRGTPLPTGGARLSSNPLAYPFPPMGTPRIPGGLHKPFTVLSPTVLPPSSQHGGYGALGKKRPGHKATAEPTSGAFLPHDATFPNDESPYPAPNLYDMTLAINSEPGLDAWWTNVVNIVREFYRADRVTLAVPADTTDLQNVPWGQKATFNSAEEDEFSLDYLPQSNIDSQSEVGSNIEWNGLEGVAQTVFSPQPSGLRPTLESRHSFSSYEEKRKDVPVGVGQPSAAAARRPGFPRTISHMSSRTGLPFRSLGQGKSELSSESLRHHTEQQSERSPDAAFADEMKGQYSGRVFPVLQTLDYEADPLIDSGGIIRVLERSDIVVLSREYTDRAEPVDQVIAKLKSDAADDKPGWSTSAGEEVDSAPQEKLSASIPENTPISVSTRAIKGPQRRINVPKGSSSGGSRDSSASLAQDDIPTHMPPPLYEDYEQTSPSPWSQSPAPSPAIHANIEENPFFTTASVDEASFDPTDTPQDYSKQVPVEAIGVDRASTIIHIPLVHPLLSKFLQPSRTGARDAKIAPDTNAPPKHRWPKSNEHSEFRLPGHGDSNKTPIAILSILSPIVPYPANLRQSLTYLAPHLATSFALSRQYSNIENEISGLCRRRHGQAHPPDPALAIGGTQRSESHVNANQEPYSPANTDDGRGQSAYWSITSPSDYSGVSRSPSGSIVGTPGWDPGSVGSSFEKRPIGVVIPGHVTGSEAAESYFNSKRKGISRPNSGVVPTLSSAILTINQTQAKQRSPSNANDMKAFQAEDVEIQEQSPQTPIRAPAGGLASATRKIDEPGTEDPTTPKRISLAALGRISSSSSVNRQEISPHGQRPDRLFSPKNTQEHSSTESLQQGADKPHTLLHSYGADFSATFQSLPAVAAISPQNAHTRTHLRTGSAPATMDRYEMPPPSERLLRTIIDSIPVQIFTAAPQNGEITWVNSKFLTYRGQTVNEFKQDPWSSIHPSEQKDYLKKWAQALRSGEQFSQQVRIRRFDGNYRWFYVRAAPLRDTRGITVHWFGTNMDIHEQHVAEVSAAREQETAASEAKYRSLANSSPSIVFAATDTEGMTFANTQWLTYSGQKFNEALGLGFMEHVHPDDLIKCKLPVFGQDPTVATNVPTSFPPQPSRHPSSASSAGLSDSSLSSNATVTAGRPKVSRMSSSDSSNLDIPVTELSELAKTGILKVSKDSDGKPSYSTEVRLRSKDGDYRWHLVRCIVVDSINFGNGEGSWFGTCTDINDHKLLEQKLKETMDSKTRFLSNMSHEIRTPIIGISGMVNFLIDSPLNSEQLDQVGTIRASSEGLLNVINDILDLSKVEAGMMKISPEWFHVRSIIEDVNDITSVLAIQKRLELNYVVDEDVPPMVKGDRVRIRQVLLNVIGNAIKFTNEGEVFVHCQVCRDSEVLLLDKEVMLAFNIVDSGSGFTEKEAELIFKPFSQIDGSSTRQHGGSGLGLVISRQLVELHGGRMRGSSVPGKGSTFVFTAKFTLPSQDDSPSVPVTPSMLSNKSSESTLDKEETVSQTRGERIAILDNMFSESPGPVIPVIDRGQDSPAVQSSGSSDPSVRSIQTYRSERSSASSIPLHSRFGSMSEENPFVKNFTLPPGGPSQSLPSPGQQVLRPSLSGFLHPPIYSILVVCPQGYSRQATVKHIEMTLPKHVPHQITERANLSECQEIIGGDSPVIFTHIVLSLRESNEVIALLDQVFGSNSQMRTVVVIISDSVQKRDIVSEAPSYDFTQLSKDHRVQFIYKPVKPSKFAVVFDPDKERDLSTDRNRDSAQLVVESQKQVFVEMEKTVGNKGHRVLLVEDNPVNQKVLLKFLSKISVTVDTALDGVQCTDKVIGRDHGYYSVILCDLHMPNKDGYQTCREIRQWERKNKYPYIPIIALSANVMADVLEKCISAGFSNYVTKPVDFKQLSKAMTDLLDPSDPSKSHELMRHRRS